MPSSLRLTVGLIVGAVVTVGIASASAPKAYAQESANAGASMPRHHWQDMTREDIRALDGEQVIAVLPVASIEQHGPHLPLCADVCQNEAVIERALDLLPDDLPVTVLPMMPVGKANEHSSFPGTLTLEPETLRRLLTEIGESVNRAGIRKLVLFNSHGGNPPILDIVARDLRVRLDMLVVVANLYSLFPQDLFPPDEMRYGIHAGSVETSIMLYLHPDLVDMDKARNFRPPAADLANAYVHLSPTGPTKFGWQAQDLNPAGAVGNALDADASRGGRLVEGAAEQLLSVLQEVDRYSFDNLRGGPLDQ